MDLFKILFLFVNVIRTYTVYNILQVFFERKRVSLIKEVGSYILLFVSTSVMFLCYSIPTLTLIVNIIVLFIITLNYESNWKKRLFSLVATYGISLAIEDAIFVLTSSEVFSLFGNVKYDSTAGLLLLAIANTIVSLGMKKFKNIKNGNDTPIIHWIASATIPILSIYIGHIILIAEGVSKIQLSLGVISILIINIAIVLIYDIVAELIEIKTKKIINERLILEKYNQSKLKLQNYENLDNFRHDQRNHLIALAELIKKGNTKEVEHYLEKMREILYPHNETMTSGNMSIDTVVNYKRAEAEYLGIDIQVDSQIPSNLEYDLFAMNIILGNLIDNAIEATSKLNEVKPILIELFLEQKVAMCIKITNYHQEKIKVQDHIIFTSKKDKKNHGIGIRSARQEVEKLKGKIITAYDENEFVATIILPIE